MHNSIQTNLLILGKSGTGKSSLLNYLFGESFAEVGDTKPTTKEGIYSCPPIQLGKVELTIYDSWGLEADKATKWKDIITAEIKKHNSKEIKDWFHSVIYCISVKQARIEDFEIAQVIKPLIESGVNICFVLTQCDRASKDELAGVTKRLQKEFNNPLIIQVCSVKELRRGQSVASEPYGKEELEKAIMVNLWNNLVFKITQEFYRKAKDSISKLVSAVKSGYNSQQTLNPTIETDDPGWFHGLASYLNSCFCDQKKIITNLDNFAKDELRKVNQKIWDDLKKEIEQAINYISVIAPMLNNEKIKVTLHDSNAANRLSVYPFLSAIPVDDWSHCKNKEALKSKLDIWHSRYLATINNKTKEISEALMGQSTTTSNAPANIDLGFSVTHNLPEFKDSIQSIYLPFTLK